MRPPTLLLLLSSLPVGGVVYIQFVFHKKKEEKINESRFNRDDLWECCLLPHFLSYLVTRYLCIDVTYIIMTFLRLTLICQRSVIFLLLNNEGLHSSLYIQ